MLRRSFLPPISEYELAADLLSRAADALIANDLALCDRLIREADLRPLRDFDYLISGPINLAIHRQSKNPTYAPIPKNELPRMPGAAVTRQIFARDGYRCRFCGSRVILKQAREKFSEALPEAARWGSIRDDRHFGLATLLASMITYFPINGAERTIQATWSLPVAPVNLDEIAGRLKKLKLKTPEIICQLLMTGMDFQD